MNTSIKLYAAGSQIGLERESFRLRNALLIFSAACILCIPFAPRLWASGPSADEPAATPKVAAARAVRLSYVEGQVQVVQDGQVIADPALVNQPLFESSQVITENDGRAEVQLEDGSLIRISPNSTLTFTVLRTEGTAARTEVVLNSGLAYFELQPSDAEHSLRVNYGQTSFSASSVSVVRLTMDSPPGDLSVFSGNIHLERSTLLQLDIHGGESLGLDVNDLSKYNLAESIEPDSWDSWNSDRDQALNQLAGERTAASSSLSYGPGMSDLDANGSWYNVPGTGYIWSPYDAQLTGAGWDPYGYGHWVYYPRYGYVWVSGYDWGYAPFQCGSWNYWDSFGWGWAPGGGCSPWWGLGGWGYNIGSFPGGYRPPRRPFPGPGRPHPVGGRTMARVAVLTVDNRPPGGPSLPSGHPSPRPGIGQPATIAGHILEPLRPMAPRQTYTRPVTSYVYRPGTTATTYYSNGVRPGSPVSGGHPRTASPPASHPSAPHASSGGGGGGHASAPAGHSGGGGGGGGGGGSHK